MVPIIEKGFGGVVISLVGSLESSDLMVSMLGVLQRGLLCSKFISEGFVSVSGVNKKGSCNSHARRCFKGWVGVGN